MNLARSLWWALLKRATRVIAVDDMRSWRGIDFLVAGHHVADVVDTKSSSERVGVLVPTSGAFGASALGVLLAGREVVPLNYLLERETLEYVIEDCGCDLIIGSRKLVDHLGYEPNGARMVYLEDLPFRSIPSPRFPGKGGGDDTAVVLYTSGTSGKPKGVMLTHKNLVSNIKQVEAHVGLEDGDCFLGVLPQFHSFGLTALTLAPMLLGCRVVYTARFVPKKIIGLIREHRATLYIGIPSMYGALLTVKDARPQDFESVRMAISGGEPLPVDTFERFKERFGVSICEGYGMTETAPVTNVMLPTEPSKGAVGRPVPWVIQRIVDPSTERDLGIDEDGELRIGGPNVMKGYLNRPEETADAFDARGHLKTGDMARIDENGFLSITGRIKEMMIVGGENVFPREIEEVLNAHPGVSASGVVGQIDPIRGEVPVAFVEPEEGGSVDPGDLMTWCRERLAGYKVPRRIEVVDELPRNPTGKVMRRALKERLDSGARA